MASSFFSDNAIAMLLAFIVALSLLKLYLEKREFFKDKGSAYVLPIVILAGIALLIYNPALKMMSIGIPFFVILVLFLFGLAAIMYTIGMPAEKILPTLKGVGMLKTTIQIAIFCIIAFAISNIYGERLLEDKSISLTDTMTQEDDGPKIDFSPLFAKQAMGMILITVVLGFAFVFVNLAK